MRHTIKISNESHHWRYSKRKKIFGIDAFIGRANLTMSCDNWERLHLSCESHLRQSHSMLGHVRSMPTYVFNNIIMLADCMKWFIP